MDGAPHQSRERAHPAFTVLLSLIATPCVLPIVLDALNFVDPRQGTDKACRKCQSGQKGVDATHFGAAAPSMGLQYVASDSLSNRKLAVNDNFIEIGYVQHSGKRTTEQQDALWNGERSYQQSRMPSRKRFREGVEAILLAVADGVAASAQPQLASKFIVDAIGALDPTAGLSAQTIRKIHAQLCDRFSGTAAKYTATTVVAACLRPGTCQIVNVGDSRAYLIQGDGTWKQLSHDHSYRNDLLEEGYLDDVDDADVMYDQLMDCLIANHEEDNFRIHVTQCVFKPWDSLLLCSDGLHDVLTEASLRSLYNPICPPADQVAIWLSAVLEAGAPDNVSIVLARLKPRGCRHTTFEEMLSGC